MSDGTYQDWTAKFKMRTERFCRLVKLGAPEFILISELSLIDQATNKLREHHVSKLNEAAANWYRLQSESTSKN